MRMSGEEMTAVPAPEVVRGLKERMIEYERHLIASALERSGGHQRRAAEALGILPTTLHEKMKRLGLKQTREPQADATLELS